MTIARITAGPLYRFRSDAVTLDPADAAPAEPG